MKNALQHSPNSPNQQGDTPKAIDIPARTKPPGRKIDAAIVAGMAKLVAKMLTESEACRRLDIKPRTWFDFKSRAKHSQQFADLVEAYRAGRIEGLIDRIEKSAQGVDVKYPDFRAALALLKITDQRRFGDSPIVDNTIHQSSVVIQLGGEEQLRKLIESVYSKRKQVTVESSPIEPKQIEPPK